MIFLNEEVWFPEVSLADEDGLLAVGGDLSVNRLLLAYRSGIFPWFIQQGYVFWFSPAERCVLFCKEIRINRSLQRAIRKNQFTIIENQNFKLVIESCAKVHQSKDGSTWISKEFINAYCQLNQLGYAKSVEVWHDQNLVGGIYGVQIGKVFCGESMFSVTPNASKMALIHLCKSGDYEMIDCQIYSVHLSSMGARVISREEFMKAIKENQASN